MALLSCSCGNDEGAESASRSRSSQWRMEVRHRRDDPIGPLTPGGRDRVVVEMIVGELGDPGPAALMDMNMLAAVPGQGRSLTDYDALLSAARPTAYSRPSHKFGSERDRGRRA